MTPFFTIIMPSYNQAPFIRIALASILDQHQDTEIRVYDALSTDGAAEILRSYAKQIILVSEKDRGMTDAINKGIRAARGNVVAWLNSDDAYLPGALDAVRVAFEEDSELAFVYGDALEIRRDGTIFTANLYTEDCLPDRYLHSHNFMCQPTVFFRRSIVDKVGLLREDLRWTMDYEWFARFHLAGLKGRRLPHFLACNRDYADTKTNSGGWARYKEMMAIHRLRPGPPLIMRPAFRIYTFEAFIKSVNGLRDRLKPGSIPWRGFNCLSGFCGDRILHMVAPRDQQQIIDRYNQQIAPLGHSLQDIWQAKPNAG